MKSRRDWKEFCSLSIFLVYFSNNRALKLIISDVFLIFFPFGKIPFLCKPLSMNFRWSYFLSALISHGIANNPDWNKILPDKYLTKKPLEMAKNNFLHVHIFYKNHFILHIHTFYIATFPKRISYTCKINFYSKIDKK